MFPPNLMPTTPRVYRGYRSHQPSLAQQKTHDCSRTLDALGSLLVSGGATALFTIFFHCATSTSSPPDISRTLQRPASLQNNRCVVRYALQLEKMNPAIFRVTNKQGERVYPQLCRHCLDSSASATCPRLRFQQDKFSQTSQRKMFKNIYSNFLVEFPSSGSRMES